jgi:hypothetical protein
LRLELVRCEDKQPEFFEAKTESNRAQKNSASSMNRNVTTVCCSEMRRAANAAGRLRLPPTNAVTVTVPQPRRALYEAIYAKSLPQPGKIRLFPWPC